VCYEDVQAARFSWVGAGGREDGTRLGCRDTHCFCAGCFKDFLKGILEDAEGGIKIFPVVCPVVSTPSRKEEVEVARGC